MQSVQDEADALPDGDEADHDGEDRRQQADDLIEHALEKLTGDHTLQRGGGGGSSLLKSFLLPKRFMVAGARFERTSMDSKPIMLPLHHPAI